MPLRKWRKSQMTHRSKGKSRTNSAHSQQFGVAPGDLLTR
eukprot:CAMPEP_0178590186 /NCGR_PEP_ID=MMETSP0697-20121206/28067_1 /TAXON_ID=265572 /ORGANISM="Extubocellulus spinifer, Strain CCMP396" /LENGTH=39 /DNA_ID= /DNA_START= /DNA_END= /DNA_ORIENTATION=